MTKHLIQVINPNTNVAMTHTIAQAARSVAAPSSEIIAVCPSQGVESIEGHFDEAIAAIGVLEQIKLGEVQGVSGHVIACFGDPGLLAARELARGPVIGIAEAAMHAIDLPVLALEDGTGLAQMKVRERCIQAMKEDNSGAIVLGCGGMANLAWELTAELGIPVIDGVTAAVKMVESLIALGLGTSKHGDLAYPNKKPLSVCFNMLS